MRFGGGKRLSVCRTGHTYVKTNIILLVATVKSFCRMGHTYVKTRMRTNCVVTENVWNEKELCGNTIV